MPDLTEILLWCVVAGVVARMAFVLASINASRRHARYRMRARLARWIWSGALHDVRVKKGQIVVPNGVLPVRRPRRGRTAERHKVLSIVRRDDSAAS